MVQPPTVTGGWLPEAPVDGPFAGFDPGGVDPGLDPGLDAGGIDPGRPDGDAGLAVDGDGEDVQRGVAGWLGSSGRSVRPAAAVAAAVLAIAVVGFTWSRAASAPGAQVDLPARPRATGAATAGSAPITTAGAGGGVLATAPTPTLTQLVVDVEGRVRRPGLVRLAAGARVADAVRAAGGTIAGAALDRLNLARALADGEQVVVPAPGDPPAPAIPDGPAAAGGAGIAGGAPTAPVDLNTATAGALDALPGVGPVLAGRIVAWRAAHGRFTTVDELAEVPGIGPKALERLRPLVRL